MSGGARRAQFVFQAQPTDDRAARQQVRAAMLARNDPSAPLPVGALEASREVSARKPYQFLLVNVLREYLALEFAVDAPFPLDVERVFDDFGARPRARAAPARPAVAACRR